MKKISILLLIFIISSSLVFALGSREPSDSSPSSPGGINVSTSTNYGNWVLRASPRNFSLYTTDHYTIHVTHSYTTTISASGSISMKIVESKIGSTWGRTESVTLDIPFIVYKRKPDWEYSRTYVWTRPIYTTWHLTAKNKNGWGVGT